MALKTRKPLARKPGSERSQQRPDIILKFKVDADAVPALPAPDEGADDTVFVERPLLYVLQELMPDRKRQTVKDYMRLGQVMVNGVVQTHFNHPLQPGDDVWVNTSRQWQTFSHPRLHIIYEDDDIIVVNKGYGLLSMGNDRVTEGTAYSLLRDYQKRKDPRNKIFIVHRLDQHTSGLMMFAKNEAAKEAMQHNWNNMVIDRRYAAIVEGRPEEKEGVVRSYLCENSQHLVYSSNDPESGGKLAVTRWRALKSRNGYTLLDVTLDTGRKNQIRVHMKDLGHPIAGDRKYGARTSPMHRLALHARTLRFIHPVTKADMNFSLPLPPSFTHLV